MTEDSRHYLELLAKYAQNPLSDRCQMEVESFFRRLGLDRDVLIEAVSKIYQLAHEPSPLEREAIVSTGVHWDPADDGWEYQQFDGPVVSTIVRRMSVPTGWLYQVRDQAPPSEPFLTTFSWHPPVFVPAPEQPPARSRLTKGSPHGG